MRAVPVPVTSGVSPGGRVLSQLKRLSDHRLVLAAQDGNTLAKQELFTRHLRRCYAFARRVGIGGDELPDIIQESIALALERFESLRDARQFSIWLSHVVLSTAHRVARRRRLRQRIGDLPNDDWDPDELPAHDGQPEVAVQMSSLRQALESLSERERRVLLLRRIEVATVDEMARVLAVSPSSVKRHIARAQASLGRAMSRRSRPSPVASELRAQEEIPRPSRSPSHPPARSIVRA